MKQFIKNVGKGKWWRHIAGLLAIIWMCIIFAFSAQTKEESGEASEGISYQIVSSTGFFFHLHLDEEQIRALADTIEHTVRKLAHMTEFGILAILVFVWLGYWFEKVHFRMGISYAFATFYAATDEIHQLFVDGRAGMLSDVCIDSAGALLSLLLFVIIRRIIKCARMRKR